MSISRNQLAASPLAVRVLPFVIFVVLTSGQGLFGEASRYWFYLAKTVVGACLIWLMRPVVTEMKWKLSREAVVVGIAVFVMWVGIDGFYPSVDVFTQNYLRPALRSMGLEGWCPKAKETTPWNPNLQFGVGSALAWLFVGVRILGSTVVVPPLEEVFYRSFLYRYVTKPDFRSVQVGRFGWAPFLVTSVVFGFTHYEWLAGILCGFAYQGLVCWKKRLGDAMMAHAITNCLLGLWVVWRGAWHFW